MSLYIPEKLWALTRRLHAGNFPRTARLVKGANWWMHKCLLPAEAVVGNDVRLHHFALGVVIHPQVTIGDGCQIFHHVTLAAESVIGSPHRIILGDRVTIGAHAIVVAQSMTSLVIGSDSIIGAGSVLTKSVPPNEVWAGNPARKIHAGENQIEP